MELKEAVLQLVEDGEAAYTCPVLYELLVGVFPHEEADVRGVLEVCHRKDFLPGYWEGAAKLGQQLLRKGLTVSAGDVQIAYAAIEFGIPLACRDRHFDLIRKVIGPSLVVRQL